jgi:acylphosphatase
MQFTLWQRRNHIVSQWNLRGEMLRSKQRSDGAAIQNDEVQTHWNELATRNATGCAAKTVLKDWRWFVTMVLHYLIQGRVQGVGFRWFVHREASELDLHGWVRNTEDGDVEVVAAGTAEDLAELRAALRRGPRGSRVDRLVERYLDESEAKGLDAFRIEGAW